MPYSDIPYLGPPYNEEKVSHYLEVLSDYFFIDLNRSAHDNLLSLADDYGVTVVDVEDSVISKRDIRLIWEAEQKAMYAAHADLFSEMEWNDFLRVMDELRLKYVKIIERFSLILRRTFRDIITKAAIEKFVCQMRYQRLDSEIYDYIIHPYEYIAGNPYDTFYAHKTATFWSGAGTRRFLVSGIQSLEIVNEHFDAEYEPPLHMRDYYNRNSLSDMAFVIGEPLTQEEALEYARTMKFP